MNDWWRQRAPRERLILAAGGALIGVLAIFQFVIAPIASWREAAARRAEIAENDYRMVYQSAAIAAPVSETDADLDAPIRNALNAEAGRRDVPLTFVNVRADGGVEMQAGPAAPANVFDLFAALNADYGVRVIQADISRIADDPANVRVQATITR